MCEGRRVEQLCRALGLPASDIGQAERPGGKASEKRLNCKRKVPFKKEMSTMDHVLA